MKRYLLGKIAIQVRDLFNSMFVVYEVGQKSDIELPETIMSLVEIIILLWNLEP